MTTENTILNILRTEKELSSSRSIGSRHYSDWKVRKALSPERGNLVRHLNLKGLHVLEINAEYGGLSRVLAENSQNFTATYETESEREALSLRLAGLNPILVNGNDLLESSTKTYDVIFAIGVLETSGVSPAVWIERVARLMTDDGILVLGAPNKLGLKYWSGAADDSSGLLFEGICDYPHHDKKSSFSRKEALGLLNTGGLTNVVEHFAYPDLLFPHSVLSRQMIETDSQLAANVSAAQTSPNYGAPRLHAFPEILAMNSVAKAGLSLEFANSFLFFASKNVSSPIQKQMFSSSAVGWHYSIQRSIPTRTVFHLTSPPTLQVLVSKTAIDSSQETKVQLGQVQLTWTSHDSVAASTGTSLLLKLMQSAYSENWELFLTDLQAFIGWSFQRWSTFDPTALDGKAVDALFINASVVDSSNPYELFDLEWIYGTSIPKTWFIFRNILALMRSREIFNSSQSFESLRVLYENLCVHFELRSSFISDLALETAFQALTSSDPDLEFHKENLDTIMNLKFRSSPLPMIARRPQDEVNLRGRYLDLEWLTELKLHSLFRKIGKFARLFGKLH